MSRLTHSSDGPQEDKKARLDQLLRELDALLSEDEEDPDDPGTIDDIERKSEEGAQRIRRLIAEKLLEKKQRFARGQSAAQPWLCSCGQVSRYVGRRPRQILLRSGCHTITRAYYYCASCQQGICPLDTGLQLCPGQCSPRLAATLARLSAYLPDRKVVQELNHFWGIEVAVSTAQRYSRRVGASIAAANSSLPSRSVVPNKGCSPVVRTVASTSRPFHTIVAEWIATSMKLPSASCAVTPSWTFSHEIWDGRLLLVLTTRLGPL